MVAASNGLCDKAISAVGLLIGKVRCLLVAAELDQLTPTQQSLDQRTSLQHVASDEQQGRRARRGRRDYQKSRQ